MAENIKENLNTHGVHVTLLPINSISEVLERVAGLIADHDTITYLEGDRVGDAFCGLICLCNKYNKTLLALELEASQQGCAISYGVQPDVVGAAALKSVNKILLGKINAGDIPVQLLEDSRRLVINTSALKQQDLSISDMMLTLLSKTFVITGVKDEPV